MLLDHFPDFCSAKKRLLNKQRVSANQTINMFERLREKWKVNGLQLFLILCTFAIGGSLTGYAGRKLMNVLPVPQNWVWVVIYIIVVTLIWPLAVLLVSILFGQYRFFTGYLKKLGRRMGIVGPQKADRRKKRIAVFASGAGSNAQKLIRHFEHSLHASVVLIVCNKPGAGVLTIAGEAGIPVLLIDKEQFFRGNGYVDELREKDIDLLVLAGFLWKVPLTLIRAFPGKIVNIHPALLPKYGGKGMYGLFVHEAVLNANETESGISIHYVDEHYDHGDLIFQARCPVFDTDTPATLAHRIHQLEHEHYPRVIESLVAEGQ